MFLPISLTPVGMNVFLLRSQLQAAAQRLHSTRSAGPGAVVREPIRTPVTVYM